VIVVDTNLVYNLFITGNRSEAADEIIGRDRDWLAPPLWRSELRNALVKSIRGNLLDLEEAFGIMVEADALMSGSEFDADSADVLELALTSGCSAYDAEFVVLARDLRVPLVTTDKELLEKFPETAVSPEVFLGRR
jgi:predicted nucleic acid-binding protein